MGRYKTGWESPYMLETLSLSADTTLTLEDSGKVIFLDAIGEAITLPSPKKGCHYKFILTATTATSSWTITTASNGTIIFGSIVVAGSHVAGASEDTITVVHTKGLAGDWFEIISDGTNWYVSGQAVTSGAITLTDV